MTAEEYIIAKSYELDEIKNNLGGIGFRRVINYDNALNIIDMVHKEDNEKAINALEVIFRTITKRSDNVISFVDIRGQFEKLLKK